MADRKSALADQLARLAPQQATADGMRQVAGLTCHRRGKPGCFGSATAPTALKFPGFCDLVSGFLRLVTVWLHVGRGGVTGSDGP